MFQYAVARTLAERLGCGLLLAGNTLGRRFGFVPHCLGLDLPPALHGMQQNGVLRDAFGIGPQFWEGRVLELALPYLKKFLFSRSFSPHRTSGKDRNWEIFDERALQQSDGTWLDGWFQSEGYFSANRTNVRHWFAPSREQSRRLDTLSSQWPEPAERMVGVHVRRGDYANINDGLGEGGLGWQLPMRFYHDALERVPSDTALAVFSDDPDWAEQSVSGRRAWISRGNSAVTDMLLMARCRFNVIANSSFSWWAGWLNIHPDKTILAPRYHLGWRMGEWLPGGIDVAGWQYIDVHV